MGTGKYECESTPAEQDPFPPVAAGVTSLLPLLTGAQTDRDVRAVLSFGIILVRAAATAAGTRAGDGAGGKANIFNGWRGREMRKQA